MRTYEEGSVAFDRGDYKMARTIMLPLAENGDVKAQISVASMYFAGLGVEQDFRQAVRWYRPAAEKGHPVAQHSLAMALLSLENIEEAVNYLLEADKQDFSVAQSCLGDIFTGAYDIPKKALEKFDFGFKEALIWYHKAGEGGFAYAYHRLGDICARGQHVAQNNNQAVTYYEKAARMGYKPSREILSRAYKESLLGLPHDLEKAKHWIDESSKVE